MLISEEYRAQQRHLHETTEYGTASINYAGQVAQIINANDVTTVLDYGAGRLNLIRAMSQHLKRQIDYRPYEPSMPQYADTPEPADMVACIDVLEHIEPEFLENVLDDLKRCTKHVGFFSVGTEPAKKILPDGRNAHLIQEGPEWWLPKIMSRFDLQTFQRVPGGFAVLVSAR